MRIVKIQKLPNGSHSNQDGTFRIIPDGYAIIPAGMETPNFPFGDIEIEKINGVMTVINWIAGDLPEQDTMSTEQE